MARRRRVRQRAFALPGGAGGRDCWSARSASSCSTVMLAPLVLSFFASIKTSADASKAPPDYLPQALSIENYLHVCNFQAGLPDLSSAIRLHGRVLAIVFCLALAVPAGYGLARFRIPVKEVLFVLLLAPLMIPYQALLTPLYLMFAKLGLANTHLGLAIVHTVLQLPFSIYLMRNASRACPRSSRKRR